MNTGTFNRGATFEWGCVSDHINMLYRKHYLSETKHMKYQFVHELGKSLATPLPSGNWLKFVSIWVMMLWLPCTLEQNLCLWESPWCYVWSVDRWATRGVNPTHEVTFYLLLQCVWLRSCSSLYIVWPFHCVFVEHGQIASPQSDKHVPGERRGFLLL